VVPPFQRRGTTDGTARAKGVGLAPGPTRKKNPKLGARANKNTCEEDPAGATKDRISPETGRRRTPTSPSQNEAPLTYRHQTKAGRKTSGEGGEGLVKKGRYMAFINTAARMLGRARHRTYLMVDKKTKKKKN